MKDIKYYVVWQGKQPGIYTSWAECELQVKDRKDARYKSFTSKSEAETAYKKGWQAYIKLSGSKTAAENASGEKPLYPSLSVDAACSGNPGKMEYRGVDSASKEEFFHKAFDLGTNNIGEFLALVHGLALLKQNNSPVPLYTDSITAIAWVRNKKAKTELVRNAKTEELWRMIERAEQWLHNNTYSTKIIKWDTDNWGEIPADFGRKQIDWREKIKEQREQIKENR